LPAIPSRRITRITVTGLQASPPRGVGVKIATLDEAVLAPNPKFLALDHKSMHVCCAESSVDRDCVLVPGNLFDCARRRPFSVAQVRKGTLAMFETMTAVMGLIGAAIFLAHAFEGICSRV